MKVVWILLGILKWLGIAVLVLLALLLLLVLFVLMSPIRYRLEGEKKTALGGTFGVRWLLGALKAEGSYSPSEGLQCRAQFLWFSLLGEKPQKKKKAKRRKKAEKAAKQAAPPAPISDLAAAEKSMAKSEPAQSADSAAETPAPMAAQAIPRRMQQKEIRRVKAPQNAANRENMEKPQADACFAKEDTPQPKTMRRVKLSEIEEKPPQMPLDEDFSAEEDAFFTGLEEATEESQDTTGKIPPICKTLWKLEGKKEIFRALRKLMGRILRGVLPGHFQLQGRFGLGDPVWTGYLLGFVGILQAKYGNDIQIEGDFAKIAAEDITLKIEGKIRLGSLLGAMLAFVLAKPVRRAVKAVWKERKAEKGKGEQ